MTQQYQQTDINLSALHTEQALIAASSAGSLVNPGRFLFGIAGLGGVEPLAGFGSVAQFIRNFGVGGRFMRAYYQTRSDLSAAGDITISLLATPPPGPQRTAFSATFSPGSPGTSRFLIPQLDEGTFFPDEDLEWTYSFAAPVPTEGTFVLRPYYQLNET